MLSVATLLAGWSCHPILAVNWTKSCVSLLTRCVIPVLTLVFHARSCSMESPSYSTFGSNIEASIWQPSDLRQALGRYTLEPALSTMGTGAQGSQAFHMKSDDEDDEPQPQVPQPSSLWFSECTEHCTDSLVSLVTLVSDVSQIACDCCVRSIRSRAAAVAQRRLVPVINCIFESAQQVQLPLYTCNSVMGKSGVCVQWLQSTNSSAISRNQHKKPPWPLKHMCSEHSWRSGMWQWQ